MAYARLLLEKESFETPEVPASPAPSDPSKEESAQSVVELRGDDTPELVMPEPLSEPVNELNPPVTTPITELPISEPQDSEHVEREVQVPRQDSGSDLPLELPGQSREPDLELPSVQSLPDRELDVRDLPESDMPELPVSLPEVSPEEDRPIAETSEIREPVRDLPFDERREESELLISFPDQTPEYIREVQQQVQRDEPVLETRFEVGASSSIESALPNIPSMEELFKDLDGDSIAKQPAPMSDEMKRIERDAEIQAMIERDSIFRNMGGA